MYAVIKTGGKQYKVAPGEKLKVELIPADVGAAVILDQVLIVGDGDVVRLGQPTLLGRRSMRRCSRTGAATR
jgi:large subunit ribosomal protein L21